MNKETKNFIALAHSTLTRARLADAKAELVIAEAERELAETHAIDEAVCPTCGRPMRKEART